MSPHIRALAVAAAVMTCVAVYGPTAAFAQAPGPGLRVGQVLDDQIVKGSSREYQVALRAGQALRVVVEQMGVDVIVVAFGPDGKPVVEVDSPNGRSGPEDVVVVATQQGTYRLAVQPFSADEAGAYKLRVISIGNASASDRRRAEILAPYAEAGELFRRGGPEKRAEVVKQLTRAFTMARAQRDRSLGSQAAARLIGLDQKVVIDAMGLASLPGARPIYYSRGARQRAETLRERFYGAANFFESQLKVAPSVALVLLSKDDWMWMSTAQYGFPAGPGTLVLWPAEHEYFGRLTSTMRRELPADVRASLAKTGLSFARGMGEAADDELAYSVALHYRRAYGLQGAPLWYAMVLAEFLKVAYWAQTPNAPSRPFHDARRTYLLQQTPRSRPLDDACRQDNLADSANWNTFGWCHAHIEGRAQSVYDTTGFSFFERVKGAFPSGTAGLSTTEIVGRLERASPGFQEWATTFAR